MGVFGGRGGGGGGEVRGSETGKRKGMHWEKRTLCHQKSHTFCVVCVLLYVQWVCLFVCLFLPVTCSMTKKWQVLARLYL